MLRMCVTLSWHDYANVISISLSVQRHWDESKANLTRYISHLLSCVKHKNTNVTTLTQRDKGGECWKKKIERECGVSALIMEDKKESVGRKKGANFCRQINISMKV